MTENYQIPFDSQAALEALAGLREPEPDMLMSMSEFLSHFRTKREAAAFIGVSNVAMYGWKPERIPLRHSIGFHLRKAKEAA